MKLSSFFRPAKTLVRGAIRWLRRQYDRHGALAPSFLIIANEPASRKVSRVLDRLRFFGKQVAVASDSRIVTKASLSEIVLARVVLEVDQGTISDRYRKAFDHVFNVDFEHNALDGWELCGMSQLLAGLPTGRRRSEAKSRFLRAVDRTAKSLKKKVYVFGTGRSLEGAIGRDFSDGFVIACNTIVRDDALWHHLRPDFIVAGDAIYHFGHTAHAQRFRSDLKKRLLESERDTFFVYPELFDAIVQRELPELKDILIPIPFGRHSDIDVNLCKRFELPALGNVLNILLLPLACTLSKSIWLWGFDGRAPDDRLFWSNSNRHSYPELMDELLKEHPAFFEKFVPKNRESSYVQGVHGDELDVRLAHAESKGYEFVMMHFSWTETLNKRALVPEAPRPLAEPLNPFSSSS